MATTKSYWFAAGLVAFGNACGGSGQPMGPATSSTDPIASNEDAGTDRPSGGPDGQATGASGSNESGLPCEVAELLGAYCVRCHGMMPLAGAPMSLLSRADLLAPSRSNPSKSYGVLSSERMRASKAPMPPVGGRVSEPEIQAFDAWVQAGMPEGSCNGVSDPFDTPLTCTSDRYWTRGDDGSSRMHPGHACIDCHTRGVVDDDELEHGPSFAFAGTVYTSAHEPNDCNGMDGEGEDPVIIEVTDARGRIVRSNANRVGNFHSENRLTYPITARVLYQGRERVMATAQNTGDCNGCHTESGKEGAPGRIMLP